jgi:hypothetical protein
LPRLPRWIPDLAAVVGLLALAGRHNPRWQGPGAAGDAPFWASPGDLLVAGPDAGAWATNALALADGRLSDLDPHRMPTWPLLVAATLRTLTDDIALAGHFVDHVLFLATPLVVYAVGRAGGMRSLAFAAGAVVANAGPLVQASRRFGVDPAVTFLVPAMLLAAWAGGRRWWLAPIAGVVAALCAVSHLTALGFPICGLLLCLFAGQPGWRRWAGGALYVAALAGAVELIYRFYPFFERQVFASVIAEGVVSTSGQGVAPEARSAQQQAALTTLRANFPAAFDATILTFLRSLRPAWLPWPAALALPWLGVIGLGLSAGKGRLSQILGGLAVGLPALLCLAPAVALAAARAPARYTDNLLPIAALLVLRGAASVTTLIEHGIRWKVPKWPLGLLGAAVAVPWVVTVLRAPQVGLQVLPPHPDDLLARELGVALRAFPGGSGAVCTIREAVAYAGHIYCPTTVCPNRDDEISYQNCLSIARKECHGTGDIPWVVISNPRADLQPTARTAMDAWVKATFPVERTMHLGNRQGWIVRVPRAP